MMPAAKHFDPVIGVDVHMVLILGVPTPIPHPFVGIVMDVMDYVQITIPVPVPFMGIVPIPLGASIQINGVYRAIAGTMGRCVPPHIPLGGPWAKGTVPSECEMFMGSSTVTFDGDAASHAMHPTIDCWCIGIPPVPRLNPKKKSKFKSLVAPTGIVMPISTGPPVYIGGPPTISLMALGMKLAFSCVAAGARRLAKSKVGQKVRQKFSRGKAKSQNLKCDRPGHPIDPVSGASANEFLDYQSADDYRFRWERTYNSGRRESGPLGYGFRHNYQKSLQLSPDGAILTDEEGIEYFFAFNAEQGYHGADRGYVIAQHDRDHYRICHPQAGEMRFQRNGDTQHARLVLQIRERVETRLKYDDSERLVEIAQSLIGMPGQPSVLTQLTYDRMGHIVGLHRGRMLDSLESIVAYEYDSQGRLSRWRDVLGAFGTYEYDDQHRLTRERDRNGFAFSYEYDERGRCTASEGQDGLWRVRLAYQPGCTMVTESDGGIWHFVFNDQGTVTEIIDPDGGILERVVDENGLVVAEVDTGGRRTEWLYDANQYQFGRRTRWGDLLPPKDQLPNPPNPLEQWFYPETAQERHWGPDLSDLTPVALPIPPDFGQLPDLLMLPPANGAAALPSEKDRAGRRRYATNSAGSRSVYTYDSEGNIVRFTDADGSTYQYRQTSWNLCGQEITPLGNRVRFDYTPHEKVRRITDALGNVSEYEHDCRDRIRRVIRHGVVHESYTYAKGDQLIAKHDSAGQLLLKIELDERGLEAKRLLASGEELSYEYDDLGNITVASTATHDVQLGHDTLGRQTSDLRDGQGVTREFIPMWGSRTTYFGRFVVEHQVQRDGILQIRTPDGGVHQLRRGANGELIRTLHNGTQELIRYDAKGRCQSTALWQPGKPEGWGAHYEYSHTNNLRRIVDRLGRSTHFEYDADHRLTLERLPDGSEHRFAYDAAGNLLSSPAHPRIHYQEGNRLRSIDGDTFEHNHRNHIALRRTGDRRVVHYEYNSLDMLVRITSSDHSVTWSAEYDGLGRRIMKDGDRGRTQFYWDGERLAAEIRPDGSVRLYVYATTQGLIPFMFLDYASLEAAPESGAAFYPFHNQVGVPLRIEDAEGEVVWSVEHAAPYGELKVTAASRIDYHLRFPGHYHDVETGLNYNRFRYYDPSLGRYLQSDPAGQAGGLNLYAYTANPLVEVDILGLSHSKTKTGTPDKHSKNGPAKQAYDRARREFAEGRDYARQLPNLFKPGLPPGTQHALTQFKNPASTYGKSAATIAKDVPGKNVDEIKDYMHRHHGPPTAVQDLNSPGAHRVQQTQWELPDGTTVRVKETVPPGNKVDAFRTGPATSVSVRKADPSGNPLPDSFQNEAFKVNSKGEPVPKAPGDIDPRHLDGLNDNQKDGFIKEVMNQGHPQTGR